MSDWTVGKVLSWAATDFHGKGFDSPRLDAELLLTAVLACDRVRLILDAARPLSTEELERYRGFIQRRRRGEPIAYILGEREFYGLCFKVDARVLVPRQDTELLVETALRLTEHQDRFGRALDVCTGSGCVAIALARQRATWRVWASDVSEDALSVARENAQRLGVPQVTFRHSDLLRAFEPSQKFDLITANPPYIPRAELDGLQPDVRDFEPHLALDGGADGLDLVRSLVEQAAELLSPGASLCVEIGSDQGPLALEILRSAGFESVELHHDLAGRDRVVSGRAPQQH